MSILDFDIYEMTGLFETQFEEIFQQLQPKITPRNCNTFTRRTPTILDTRCRLLLVLNWLKENCKYSVLANRFHVSKSVVAAEIYYLLPKIVATLQEIKMPEEWVYHSFERVVGALDCTSHFRYRVHPRQADWYC